VLDVAGRRAGRRLTFWQQGGGWDQTAAQMIATAQQAASVLATIGLAAVGTIYGALTGAARARETLLPMLVLPIVIPVLIAGVRCWQAASVASGPRFGVWLSVLGAFAVIYVAAGVVLYGQIEEVQ
jgi:heme exporter protein B